MPVPTESISRLCGVEGEVHQSQGGILPHGLHRAQQERFLEVCVLSHPLFRITALSAGAACSSEETERLK